MPNDRAAVYDVPGFHKDLYKEQITPNTTRIASTGNNKAAGFGDGFMPEVFHRLYATTPSKVEKPAISAAVRAKMHTMLSELPEFDTLRKQTVRDPLWSGMATTALSESVCKAIPQQEKRPDADKAERILDGLKHLQESGMKVSPEMMAQAEGTAAGQAFATAEQAEGLDETALRSALREGIAAAGDRIADAESAMSALGYGTDAGGISHRNPAVAIELARRVAASAQLRKIIEVAGRLTATARAKRASRTNYARSEIVGVEPTRMLSRILPSELGHLATPLGTANLWRRLTENAALGYSMQGKEKEVKGPIILCIDQSGSMEGDRNIWAKGIALALLDAARAEKRAFGVILYDSIVNKTMICPDPQNVPPANILDILSSFSGGGTAFQPALTLALSWIGQAGKFTKADIVHITDGEAGTSGSLTFRTRAAELGVTTYGISIDSSHGQSLAAWSDSVTHISDVNRDTAAVNTIFDNIG